MKKILFAALAAIVLASCAKTETGTDETSADGTVVNLIFTPAQTRAFFDNTATAEPWEKEVHSITVYVFNQFGTQVMRKHFDTVDVNALQSSFKVPKETKGTTCTFYVVANGDGRHGLTNTNYYHQYKDELPLRYNGTFEKISAGGAREDGFIMSGAEAVQIPADGSPVEVSVLLRRTVAKVAIKIDVDPTLQGRYYGGTLVVRTAMIYNTPMATTVLDLGDNTQPATGNISQNSVLVGNSYCNLFYLYDSPAQDNPDKRPTLRLDAVFDQDGDSQTAGDQIYYNYEIPLTGSGDGEIKRNGYYRISARITDLDVVDAKTFYEVAEWDTPATQDLGNIEQ